MRLKFKELLEEKHEVLGSLLELFQNKVHLFLHLLFLQICNDVFYVELWDADIHDVIHDDLEIAECHESAAMVEEWVDSEVSFESEDP